MNVHEIIKNAVAKNKIEIRIPLTIDGQEVEFMLDELDAYDIQEAIEIKNQQALGRALTNGLIGMPLSDLEWKEFLDKQSPKDRENEIKEGKPIDRARFFARKIAGTRILLDVIPRSLKLLTGEYVCVTDEDLKTFTRWLSTNKEAFDAISSAFIDLSKRVKQARDEAKKSSSLTNGISETDSQDATTDTEDLSAKN